MSNLTIPDMKDLIREAAENFGHELCNALRAADMHLAYPDMEKTEDGLFAIAESINNLATAIREHE